VIRLAAALLLLAVTAAASAQSGTGAGGLTALPASDQAGSNLVVNGGFETAGNSGSPEAWTTSSAVWTVDAMAHGGRAALKLAGAETQRMVPSAEQGVSLEPGYYTLEGWIKTSKLAAGDPRSGVRLCLDARPRLNWWKCTDTVRGSVDWSRFSQPMIGVTDAGRYRVTVGAYGLPDGEAWFDDVSLVRVGRGALDVFLLYPNYRGLLFDDRPQTVRVAVGVSEDARARNPRARARLSLVDEQTAAVRLQRDVAGSSRAVVELDAAALPHGAYRLRGELVTPDGEVLHRYPDYRIVKAPAAARKRFAIWYDERNVAWIHGRPSFVLGLYTTTGYSESRDTYARGDDGWGVARMAEAPINMVINYWLGATPVPALQVYMDELNSRGMYYLQTVNFYYADNAQYKTLPYPAAREGDDALNRWVARTLVAHRGLAGFYTADERPADMVPRVFRQHRILSDAAPGTVTYGVMGDGWENQAPLWRDAVDVMGLDPYPVSRPAGQNDLAMVGEWTRLGRDAVQGSRPLWMVMQYFPLTSAAGWPSYEDLRTMSWMAIIDGATGLFYWSYGTKGLMWIKDRAVREAKWKELVRITKEIKGLEGVLLAPDTPVVAGESGDAVHVLGKRGPDGARYLFAYNTRKTPVRVTWTLTDAAREARELDAGPVALDGARLTAEFNPYEVKRYRIQ
jgi:hypothetical protein